MALRYCFEQSYVARTLAKSKSHDLAVVDIEGCEDAVKSAVKRGVFIYGYLNAGALEKERPYYPQFKHLRLAPYDGWDGEFWIDPTDREWQQHLVSEAERMKKLGVIGLYLDNTDIYYEILERQIKRQYDRNLPSAKAVYNALTNIILNIRYKVGLIVMPNGGDVFLREFMVNHPNAIATINQEGVFFEELNKKNKSSDTTYYKSWCKWAQKRISGKVRIIEYTSSKTEQAKIKAYCVAHGWDVYFSYHKDLRGD